MLPHYQQDIGNRQDHIMTLMAHAHCTGPGQGQGPGNDAFLYVLYTLHRDKDRDREPLFSIVPIPVPVPIPVLVLYSLYEAQFIRQWFFRFPEIAEFRESSAPFREKNSPCFEHCSHNNRNLRSTIHLCGYFLGILSVHYITNGTGQWSGTDIGPSVSTCTPPYTKKSWDMLGL